MVFFFLFELVVVYDFGVGVFEELEDLEGVGGLLVVVIVVEDDGGVGV